MPARTWARRLEAVRPFHVMALLARARAMAAAGRDIIHLEVGEPDFPVPPAIQAAGLAALTRGDTFYTPALGLPALREAIAADYAGRFGVPLDPGRVVVTPGASGALLLALALVADPGREVLVADPGYPCNRNFLAVLGAVARQVPVGAECGFALDADALAMHWSATTAAALVASPANPTGQVLAPTVLRALADRVRQLGGHLLVDEIYQGLVYGRPAHTVLAEADDVIVLNSFSKFFGMTGWRVGWLVAPESAMTHIERLAQNLFIAAPTLAQHAALAAFEPDTLAELEQRRQVFSQRIDFLLPALEALGLRIPVHPQGAFYIYADISPVTALDGYVFSGRLLDEEGVAVTPGIDFGEHGASQHIRFACTTGIPRLEEAVARIGRFLSRHGR